MPKIIFAIVASLVFIFSNVSLVFAQATIPEPDFNIRLEAKQISTLDFQASPEPIIEGNFLQYPLTDIANQPLTLQYLDGPTGGAVFGGIPFTFPSGNNIATTYSNYDSYSIDTNVANVSAIHILANTGNTWIAFNGRKMGEVIAEFSDGSSFVTDLVVGNNIREWLHGNPYFGGTVNTTTDPNTQEVYRTYNNPYFGNPGPAVIDMTTIHLPQNFIGKTLTKITLADIIPTRDPHLNWYGLTIEGGAQPVAPTPFLDLPWDYQGQGKTFEDVGLHPNSWFDHEYPFQNIACCVQRVMTYIGETKNDFYRSHNGYDYGSLQGVGLNTPVLAAASGWATFKSEANSDGAGNVIKIDHENGYQTWYEHLQSDGLVISNENGKVFVNKGQPIGKVGMTGITNGPHIHFSVFRDLNNNETFDDDNPMGATDPLGWEKKPEDDPWPRDKGGAQSHNLFVARAQPQSTIIPASGGSQDNGKVKITVPSGAAAQGFKLTFKNGPFEKIADNLKSIGPSFFLEAFGLDGQKITQFNEPIDLSYYYSGDDISNIDESGLKLYAFNESTLTWEQLLTGLDEANDIISGQTSHFSQFAVMGEVKDLTPPTTQIALTGDKGQENWYRSNVAVELTGEDNEGGIGLQYTLYTTNGNDWFEYSQPLIFDQEGSYKITYQSFDKYENTEERKTVEFNIDKVTPEAKIYVDPDKKDLVVKGSEDSNIVTVVNGKNLQKTYAITDQAGNTVKLDVRDFDIKKLDSFKLYSIAYNQNAPTQVPKNSYIVLYNGKLGKLNVKEQLFTIKDVIKVRITYDRTKDKSTIYTMQGNSLKQKEIRSGLVLLQLKTNKGNLDYSY